MIGRSFVGTDELSFAGIVDVDFSSLIGVKVVESLSLSELVAVKEDVSGPKFGIVLSLFEVE